MSEGTKVAGGEFKFYVGDVVQFATIYRWCDGAALNTNYTVVDEVTMGKWMIDSAYAVNGHTKEISLKCVNEYWQDFMLVSRAAPPAPVITQEPVTVNITINPGEEINPKDEFTKRLTEYVRRSIPSGGLFGGGDRPFSTTRTENHARIEKNLETGSVKVYDSENVLRVQTGGWFDNVVNDTPKAKPIPVGEGVAKVGAAVIGASVGPIKSDGGSSSYYDLPIPDELMNQIFDRWENGQAYIKTEEMIRYFFGNDFSFGTALKSLVRAYGATQGGGKEGNDVAYDCSKVAYYADQIKSIHQKDQ